jgi:hypothetical protein
MLWLTRADADAQNFQVRGSPTPQMIEFPADLNKLGTQIPVSPHFEQEGFIPSASYQWYGWINKRPVILEREKDHLGVPERVFLHTSYLENQDQSGDWMVLLDLSELPDSIHIGRPNFIQSRVRTPEHVVFRSEPAGWNAILYNASSHQEAEALLKFLRLDKANDRCFIGPPEPQGSWSAIHEDNGRQRVLCTYPLKSAAISFACRESLRAPSVVLVVKYLSNLNPDRYFVSQGRIIRRVDG